MTIVKPHSFLLLDRYFNITVLIFSTVSLKMKLSCRSNVHLIRVNVQAVRFPTRAELNSRRLSGNNSETIFFFTIKMSLQDSANEGPYCMFLSQKYYQIQSTLVISTSIISNNHLS